VNVHSCRSFYLTLGDDVKKNLQWKDIDIAANALTRFRKTIGTTAWGFPRLA